MTAFRFAVGVVLCVMFPLQTNAETPMRPKIVGLSHIALYVHDIERSRAFYKDLLGFDEPFSLKRDDGSLHLTWIKINDQQTIELFPEKEAKSDRLYHIAVETDDAVAMRNYLASRGVAVPEKVNTGKIGRQDVYHLHIHIIGGPTPLGRMVAKES